MNERLKEYFASAGGCLLLLLIYGGSIFLSGAAIVLSVWFFLFVINLCCGVGQ